MTDRESRRSPDALTFMMRAMIYEVWVVAFTGAAITVLLFVSMGRGITDLYLQIRGVGEVSGEVAQVTIGDEALYLWDPSNPSPEVTPRGLLTEVVGFLDRAGASVVVLDILLDRPEPGDEALAQAARRHGAVVAAERYTLTEPAAGLMFQPGLVEAYDGAVSGGFANLYQRTTIFSQDLLVRGAPLVKRVTRARVTGTWPNNLIGAVQDDHAIVPSLALSSAWLFRRKQQGLTARVGELERTLGQSCDGVPLDCTIELPQLGLPAAGVSIEAVLPINFRAPEHSDPLPTVRAADILRVVGQTALMRQLDPTLPIEVPAAYREVLEGRVVVVGRASQGDEADRFITPFGFPAYLNADMAGCRVQAQLIDTLISGRHIRVVGGVFSWLGAAGLFAGVFGTFRRTSDRAHVTSWLAVATGLVLAGAMVFRVTDGIAFDTGPPVAGILAGILFAHIRVWALEAMR